MPYFLLRQVTKVLHFHLLRAEASWTLGVIDDQWLQLFGPGHVGAKQDRHALNFLLDRNVVSLLTKLLCRCCHSGLLRVQRSTNYKRSAVQQAFP